MRRKVEPKPDRCMEAKYTQVRIVEIKSTPAKVDRRDLSLAEYLLSLVANHKSRHINLLRLPRNGECTTSRRGASDYHSQTSRCAISAGDITTHSKDGLLLYDGSTVRPTATYRSTNGWRPLMRPWSVNNAHYRTCLSDGSADGTFLPSQVPASHEKGLSTWMSNRLYESIYYQHRK